MATARARLMQLSLAQQEAQEFAQRGKEGSEPKGGGILQRPIRPSEAKGLDPEKGTPFRDFADDFLNTLGITTARQRRAQLETLTGIDEANKIILSAVQEQMALVARRGVGGINAERFQEINNQLESAAKLLDNPVTEIQEFGRAQIQSAANSLDEITTDQKGFLDQQRDRIQGRLDGLIDLGRQEQRVNDDVIAVLNARGERNGMNSKLSSFEKQIVSNYLNGSTFAQKEGEGGILESIPGFLATFDPTEELTVGNATVLVEAVRGRRIMTITDQVAKENKTAIESGFKLNDKDGRLTVNEIAVPELGPEVERVRYGLPQGTPLSIQPGVPSEEDSKRNADASLRQVQSIPGIGPVLTVIGESLGKGAGAISNSIDSRNGPQESGPTNPNIPRRLDRFLNTLPGAANRGKERETN